MEVRPILKTEIPGPLSRELRVREDRFLAPGVQNFALLAGIVVEKAQGSWITDVDGNVFLDFIGGIGVNGLGHSHPSYIRALTEQLEKISVGSFTSIPRIKLLEKIIEVSPSPKLNRLQLYSSGAEAVESALRLAKSHTGKYEFVGFSGGFHGKTMGALSLMGSDFKKGLGPFVPGNHIVPYANCYRCPAKLSYPTCKLACVDMAREQIKRSSEGKIAAFIIEPMQGTAGNIIPPKDYLGAIAQLAREFGALLIVDEMITGFGRTGLYWGSQHSGVIPDIITLGKQFGGGFPVSGLLTTTEIAQSAPWSNPSGSSSSYGGNPLASSATLASLEIIEKEGLVENSRKMGQLLLNGLKERLADHRYVGEIRGEGLLVGVELVESRETREPLSKALCRKIFDGCLKRGLLTMAYAPGFRLQPAMTVRESEIDLAVEILGDVFDSDLG